MNASQPPNILWLITDDTGFDMLGYTGGPPLTPNIDHIAQQGVLCTHFHTATAACTPSRFSYLTGQYPGRCTTSRFHEINPPDQLYRVGFETDLLPPTPNLASILQQNGYYTGYVGKYHTGTPGAHFHGDKYDEDDDPRDPAVAARLAEDYQAMQAQVRSNGFDYAEGLAWGNLDFRPLKALRYHNLEWHTDAALTFLDQAQACQQPFFLKLATSVFHGPHHVEALQTEGLETEAGMLESPPHVQPPRQTLFDRVNAAGYEVTHRTAGAVWADDAFGAVLDRLEQLGLAHNTIVIYSTDHGPGTSESKFTCYQGGVHIPFCLKWPSHIEPGSTCDALLQNIDLPPTLLSMIGITPPAEVRFDGRDRFAQLRGAADDRTDLYFEWGRLRAVRTRQWKYITLRYTTKEIDQMRRSVANGNGHSAYLPYNLDRGGDFAMHRHPHYWNPDQLYDLDADPTEQHNLLDTPGYDSVVRDMQHRLRNYLENFRHPYPLRPNAFQLSPEYRELTRRNMADQSIYDQYFYVQNAY